VSQLLTIIVPTYNRASSLMMLLDSLVIELSGLEQKVAVIIGDNASTDDTPTITARFASQWSSTRVLRHVENLGADENFCRCVEMVDSRYFWIVGDDDLPRSGAIQLLVDLLECHTPDLVYLTSLWMNELTSPNQAGPVMRLGASLMEQRAFALRVHVWMTFISGTIIKRTLAPNDSLRRFAGSRLVQLGWVLSALTGGQKFIYVSNACVLATAGNTGGYGVLKVFGNNFQSVIREALTNSAPQRKLAEQIVRRTTIAFLPNLVCGVRRAQLGAFDSKENIHANLEPQLGSSRMYRWFVRPLESAGPLRARAVLQLARMAAQLVRMSDFLHMHLAGHIRAIGR
jgi:abequosyltransferase